MATFTTVDAVGEREDLIDVIYDISPTDTPVMSSIGRTNATAVNHEWQTDQLAAATTVNYAAEGQDATAATAAPTSRLGNYTQIVQKTIQVSGTLDTAVDKAGRASEKQYQVSKASEELKRDIELIINSNQAKAGTTTTRKMGTLLSWITTNVNKGASGTNPTGDGSDIRSDDTTRTFTETMLKDAVQQVYTSGGSPELLVVPTGLKSTVSAFTGIAEHRVTGESNQPRTIIANADAYLSDFGLIQIVPNRFMRATDALILDPEYAALAYLRPFVSQDLAKTGDSEKTQILAELTLQVSTEQAHGGVFDLNAA